MKLQAKQRKTSLTFDFGVVAMMKTREKNHQSGGSTTSPITII
jgi:hypothetical protein